MLTNDGRLLLAKNDLTSLTILPRMLNRHGLITGATGTGKTISLQVIAESISAAGVPVFITDIKGDVSGISAPGAENKIIKERMETMKLPDEGYSFQNVPVCFWDIFGEKGHPLRATISEMGPLLISRILDLNDTQTGVMQILFRVADDSGLLLLDLKDLRMLVAYVSEKENREPLVQTYGNIAPATLGAIQRGLLTLEEQGGDVFFGEPALELHDFMRVGDGGKGIVNILAADRLMRSPRVYASFLLYLLSEFYENLPEVGDLPKPKMVLFFDEAHLIFADAPKILLERIEQVVRLVRSKGVGVYFITQNPADIPESVLAQLGNRVQHALRAYTPKERKAVKAAAESFRENPAFKTEDVITELGVGEALVSLLDEKGIPGMVERAFMLPPQSRIGPVADSDRDAIRKQSLLFGRYENAVDRESAYEILNARVAQQAQEEVAKAEQKAKKTEKSFVGGLMGDFFKKTQQSVTRNVANQVGRTLIRGLLGGLFGK